MVRFINKNDFTKNNDNYITTSANKLKANIKSDT